MNTDVKVPQQACQVPWGPWAVDRLAGPDEGKWEPRAADAWLRIWSPQSDRSEVNSWCGSLSPSGSL